MRRLPLALLMLAALAVYSAPAFGADDQRILHVLNRLAFGPRPGDVERVRAAGLPAWIDRQLHPETIDDSATERALAEMPSLRVYGRWPGLARDRLFEGRDLAVTTDFRTLFSEVARHHLGVPSTSLFPGWKAAGPLLGLFS